MRCMERNGKKKRKTEWKIKLIFFAYDVALLLKKKAFCQINIESERFLGLATHHCQSHFDVADVEGVS